LKSEKQLRTIKTHEGAEIYDIVVNGDELFSIGSDKRVVQTNLKVVSLSLLSNHFQTGVVVHRVVTNEQYDNRAFIYNNQLFLHSLKNLSGPVQLDFTCQQVTP
jgi:hypothetical protein